MELAVQAVVDAFVRLSVEQQHQVVNEILSRVRDPDWSVDVDTIDRIADESFLEYDRREAADADC